MNCPVCANVNLLMTERQGVEIDYCPKCRGVWLDRGELDKLIEKAAVTAPAQGSYDDSYRTPPPPPGYRTDAHHDRKYHKKRRGFLGDLFDFD